MSALISALLSSVVGVVLLASGLLKAVDAKTFSRQLARYRHIPPRHQRAAVAVITALECALGAALVVQWAPSLVLPSAILVLAVLAGLTLWAEKRRHIEECGCYGGIVVLTPMQSVGLDAVYIVLVLLAWATIPPSSATAPWRVVVVAASGLAAGTLSAFSHQEALIDLARLRRGRRWNKNWLERTDHDLTSGSHFVVFLSQDCPWCKSWVPLLNILGTQPDLPRVTGVMSIGDAEVEAFRQTHLVRFPIAYMKPKLASAMISAYPTAALVENGTIVEKWEGSMPEEFLQRLQNFYGGIAPPEAEQRRFTG
jgi:Methylamine utilisation protein MauE